MTDEYNIIKQETINDITFKLCSDSFSLGCIYFVLVVDNKTKKSTKVFPSISSVQWFANRMYNKMLKGG